ncbi:hypothetical protein GWI33_014795 [Rhynchophorus ferrugineus]|uniref:Uncharacterized protein n=1 Tax=Rhynchophorus ferrugineus TaxID=354439 RepID=A0A834I6C9_RHYFE|nr:hypothetical protein GWI33_014795 [Rhynchophorus ferrugineus]
MSTEDGEGSGSPKEVATDENIKKIHKMILNDLVSEGTERRKRERNSSFSRKTEPASFHTFGKAIPRPGLMGTTIIRRRRPPRM